MYMPAPRAPELGTVKAPNGTGTPLTLTVKLVPTALAESVIGNERVALPVATIVQTPSSVSVQTSIAPVAFIPTQIMVQSAPTRESRPTWPSYADGTVTMTVW